MFSAHAEAPPRPVRSSISGRVSYSLPGVFNPLRFSPFRPSRKSARGGRRVQGPPGSTVSPWTAASSPVRVSTGSRSSPGQGPSPHERHGTPARSLPPRRPGPGPRTPSPPRRDRVKHSRCGDLGAKIAGARRQKRSHPQGWQGIGSAEVRKFEALDEPCLPPLAGEGGSRRLTDGGYDDAGSPSAHSETDISTPDVTPIRPLRGHLPPQEGEGSHGHRLDPDDAPSDHG